MPAKCKELMTKRELNYAIKRAKEIFVTIKFGVLETPIKITKKEAIIIANYVKDEFTPDDMEMYGGAFGRLYDTGELYLG